MTARDQRAESLLARVAEARRELCRTIRAVEHGRRTPDEVRDVLRRARCAVYMSVLLRRQHRARTAIH